MRYGDAVLIASGVPYLPLAKQHLRALAVCYDQHVSRRIL